MVILVAVVLVLLVLLLLLLLFLQLFATADIRIKFRNFVEETDRERERMQARLAYALYPLFQITVVVVEENLKYGGISYCHRIFIKIRSSAPINIPRYFICVRLAIIKWRFCLLSNYC